MSDNRPHRLNWSRTLLLVIAAVVMLAVVLFVAQNFVVVEVRLVSWHIEARLAWVVLIGAMIGFVAGFGASRLRRLL